MNYEETVKAMGAAAAVVKMVCGVANNAAWLVTLDGYDHAKLCKGYRQGVKKAFGDAISSWHRYECRLLYAKENRMFRLEDMSPEVRARYGDITNREYYDFWAALGVPAYNKTKHLLGSLWNKYRKSLVTEGVTDADHVAWVMVAMAALELAVSMYGKAVDECVSSGINRRIVENVFGQFCLKDTAALWRKALVMLCPGTDDIEPSESDKHNIELGLEQLCEAWVDPTLLYTSTMEAVDDYKEIFRTKKELRMAKEAVASAKRETEAELRAEKLKLK